MEFCVMCWILEGEIHAMKEANEKKRKGESERGRVERGRESIWAGGPG